MYKPYVFMYSEIFVVGFWSLWLSSWYPIAIVIDGLLCGFCFLYKFAFEWWMDDTISLLLCCLPYSLLLMYCLPYSLLLLHCLPLFRIVILGLNIQMMMYLSNIEGNIHPVVSNQDTMSPEVAGSGSMLFDSEYNQLFFDSLPYKFYVNSVISHAKQ